MIRYGTIGTNFIVDRFQEAAMENPSLHYSAVYSRNQETAGNFAAKYGVETTYTDLNAFACADDLDAVYIASCNFSYRIQIKATSNPYNSLNPLTWSESP